MSPRLFFRHECRKAGLPSPEYRLGGGFVVLVFRYAPKAMEENPIATPQPPHSNPTVTPQVGKLIAALSDGSYSPKEIMEAIGLKDKSNFLENYLNAAIGLEFVETVYPGLTKHSPKQKYRLTEQGKALLKGNK